MAASEDRLDRASPSGRKAKRESREARPARPDPSLDRTGGLPARLRKGVEALSGLDMDEVRVHRNSPEPAKLGALAFARGTDIHPGPGQETHLPHEAWHMVQQKQGRVAATSQVKAIGIDDDVALEAEADRLGSRAAGEVDSVGATPDAVHDAALQPSELDGNVAKKAKKAKPRQGEVRRRL